MKRSEAITKIAPALIKFNSEVGKIEKDGENKYLGNKYATLDSIVETVRPVLSANKLAVMQDVISGEGVMTVKTLLLHESGEWMESEGTTLRLQKVDPQSIGAAITYARRYDLSAFLSLNTGEDNDGNNLGDGLDPNAPQPITQEQVGLLKVNAMKFAEARNRSLEDVYKVLKISNLTRMTEKQADVAIDQLNKWLANLDKEVKKDDKPST